LTIEAVLDGKYKASATVEILPEGVASTGPAETTTVKLLEKKAAINTAKTDPYALVPILITNRPKATLGALSAGPTDEEAPLFALGLDPAEYAGFIFEVKNKSGKWEAVNDFGAEVYTADGRYIKIWPNEGAKTRSGVRVSIMPKAGNGRYPIVCGSLDITVSAVYPKITLSLDAPLNAYWKEAGAGVTAKAADGSAVTVKGIAYTGTAVSNPFVSIGADNQTLYPIKAGTGNVTVQLSLAGYKQPFKTTTANSTGTAMVFKPVVVNKAPGLKLSPGTVTLGEAGAFEPTGAGMAPVTVSLLPSDKKVLSVDSLGTVADISLAADNDLTKEQRAAFAPLKDTAIFTADLVRKTFTVGFADTNSFKNGGKLFVKVKFEGGAKPVILPLVVNKPLTIAKTTLKADKTSLTWNMTHTGEASTITLSTNQSNRVFAGTDFKLDYVVLDSKGTKVVQPETAWPVYVNKSTDVNTAILSLNETQAMEYFTDASKPWPKSGKHLFRITDTKTNKSVDITVVIVNKAATFTTKTSGKMDIASPAPALTVTAAFKDTTSSIKDAAAPVKSVKLYTQNVKGKKVYVPAEENPDFEAVRKGPYTFDIVPKVGRHIKSGVTTKLSVEITLTNGQVLTSWGAQDLSGAVVDKPVTITPVQTACKAFQSKKAVTLYKGTPLTGESLDLSLTTPAGVKTGMVRLQQKSLNDLNLVQVAGGVKTSVKSDGFRLVRSGEKNWTLYFADNMAPLPKAKNTKLRASYNVKVELWAEGTFYYDYTEDPAGKFVALGKPTVATIKVNIK
jgi:hypothetical protein